MKFVICSPRQVCGGPIVLHVLCKFLCEAGHDAKIFYFAGVGEAASYQNKFLFWKKYAVFFVDDLKKSAKAFIARHFPTDRNGSRQYKMGYHYQPVKGCRRQFFPFFNKRNTIVVYPEIVYGNFLNATHVVRWLLYYNRYDDTAFGKNDLVIAYRQQFNDVSLNPLCRTLRLSNFDSDLYRRYNFSERKGNCYIVRKGRDRKDLPAEYDGIVIDNLTEREKVEVFNQCEWCYSYDMQTFYTTIAALCGCKVVCVPEEGKSRADYLKTEDTRYGVAFGTSEKELEWAEATRDKIQEKLDGIEERNKTNVERFIKFCEEYNWC